MARTRRWRATVLLPFLLSISAFTAAPVSAAVDSAVVNDIANPDAYTCDQAGFIDFEDLADGFNLSSGAIGGVQFTTTSGFSWMVGDFATGGYNGKYPSGGYTSKGTHWAWLGVNAGAGRIDFVNGPASVISLLASVNNTVVSLQAYSAANVLLATAGPSSVNFNTGHMDELRITRATADVAYVVVHDSGNFFEVDAICTDAPGVNQPTPPHHPGTIPGPYVCGTYVRGGEGSGVMVDPTTYDYVIPSPLGISGAGSLADHHWVHSLGTEFIVYDMGSAVPEIFLVPSIDHTPIPDEAMEATLYGSNSLASPEGTWEAGTITDIYDQGVDPAWISDDYATRWTFSTSYRYIGILRGGPAAIVDDGDAEIDAICTPRTNTPPTAGARGPYAGNEGSAIAISGTASDPDAGDTVTTSWSYTDGAGVDAGAICTFADPSALSTTVTCTDDGTYILTLTASDGVNPPVTSAPTNLVVANVAPIVTITSPTDGALYAIGTPVALSAPFTDAGANDTHTCTVNWDDGAGAVGATVAEVPGSGTCSSSKTYTAAGVYTITVAVTDDDLDVGTASVMIIVYDPTAGFVTGGGWINSPAGAYVADPTLTGKANFGFVSKYKKGASVPTGDTEFQFHAGSFNFHSEAYQWLVVAGCKAQYKGTGMVNGVTGYGFLLTATDGDICASKTTDKFRIKVWLVSTKAIVYDNKMGASDDIDAANPQAIAGGQIVIHK